MGERDATPAECLSDGAIAALVEQRVDAAERARAEAHIDVCSSCRAVVATVARCELESRSGRKEAVTRPAVAHRAPATRVSPSLRRRSQIRHAMVGLAVVGVLGAALIAARAWRATQVDAVAASSAPPAPIVHASIAPAPPADTVDLTASGTAPAQAAALASGPSALVTAPVGARPSPGRARPTPEGSRAAPSASNGRGRGE